MLSGVYREIQYILFQIQHEIVVDTIGIRHPTFRTISWKFGTDSIENYHVKWLRYLIPYKFSRYDIDSFKFDMFHYNWYEF